MDFRPRVNEAISLAVLGPPTAMIDLSDGLSRDLGHVCRESGVGAVVVEANVPVHEDAIKMRRDGRTPLDHALNDGEDYELLFTLPAAMLNDVRPTPMVIGAIQSERGVWLEHADGTREPLEPKGWEHSL
jgi:thiamine-monophosphate kinase